jgi:hypothetical protein
MTSELDAFRVAYASENPVELNRVKAVERGVDQLYNYIAEPAAFGLELVELRGRRDETNARRDLDALRDAGVISREMTLAPPSEWRSGGAPTRASTARRSWRSRWPLPGAGSASCSQSRIARPSAALTEREAHRPRVCVSSTTCWNVGRFWNGNGGTEIPLALTSRFMSKQPACGSSAHGPWP